MKHFKVIKLVVVKDKFFVLKTLLFLTCATRMFVIHLSRF
jgi:hypothetical protein